MEWYYLHCPSEVFIRVFLCPALLDARQIVASLIDGYVLLEPPYRHWAESTVALVRIGAERTPHVLMIGKRRIGKNTNDGIRRVVIQTHVPADDLGVLAKHAFPEAVAQQCNLRPIRPIFLGSETSTYHRSNAKHVE
jgi:hypothetical protein